MSSGEQGGVVKMELRRIGAAELIAQDAELRRAPVFRAMPDEVRTRLLDGSVARRFAAGTPLFRQGDPAAAVFVVLRGEVRLRVLVDVEAVTFASAGKGELVGEAELATHAAVRAHTAYAFDEVDVLEIPAAAFRAALFDAPAVRDVVDMVHAVRRRKQDEMSDFLSRW